MKRAKYTDGLGQTRDCVCFGVHLNEYGALQSVIQVEGRFLIDLVHYSRVAVEDDDVAETIQAYESGKLADQGD